MRFLLDENVDYQLASFLRFLGHDATTIVDDYAISLKDDDILAIAHKEDRIIVTNDKDFGELVFLQKLAHKGIILFRLSDESLEIKKHWLQKVLIEHPEQLGHFIVITDRSIGSVLLLSTNQFLMCDLFVHSSGCKDFL